MKKDDFKILLKKKGVFLRYSLIRNYKQQFWNVNLSLLILNSMKFLRMPNKAPSQKAASKKNLEADKENIAPIVPCQEKSKPQEVKTQMESQEHVETFQVQTPCQKQQIAYQKEIFLYLLAIARQPAIKYNYFSNQPDITQHMRRVLLNWLIDVHLKYKLQTQTLFITVNIIDEYLSKQIIYRNELQLLGITSLWIAAKYQETYQVPKINNLVYICDSTYTGKQILDMESKILQEINFDFLRVTTFTYYDLLRKYTHLNQKDYFLGRYLLECMLFEVKTRKYSELMRAASVIFFIQKLRGYQLEEDKKIQCISEIDGKILKECAKQICFMWQRMHYIEEMSSLKQKFMRPQFLQVSKIKLSQKSEKTTK